MDLSVACNVEMIADVAESPVEDVVQSAGFRRKGFPLRRGTAMNDNQCDSSGVTPPPSGLGFGVLPEPPPSVVGF